MNVDLTESDRNAPPLQDPRHHPGMLLDTPLDQLEIWAQRAMHVTDAAELFVEE